MPSKFDNLTRNSSSDKVGAKSHIRRVGETGRGGGDSVDWVGRGKSTKVVELEELGLRLPLAVNNRVVMGIGKRKTRHPQSSSKGGGGDNTTSSVSSKNLANGVGLSLCLPLAVDNRGGVTKSRNNSSVREAGNLEATMIGGGGDHTTVGSACQHLANCVGFGIAVNS